MPDTDHTFSLHQNGLQVVTVTGTDRLAALREIMHYAMVYSTDGPVTVRGVTSEDWTTLNSEKSTK